MNSIVATTRHFPWRAAGPLMLAVAAATVLPWIPLPGFDPAAVARQLGHDRGIERFSIFALGAYPLFTVLAYVEIIRLLVSPLAGLRSASPLNAGLMNAVIVIAVVLLTALQALVVQQATVGYGFVERSTMLTFAAVGSFVGVSLLVIWLCGLIRIPGLESGIWVFLSISYLNTLPYVFIRNAEYFRYGAVSGGTLLISGAGVLAAIAIVVTMYILLRRTGCGRGAGQQISLSVLLWPPFLADTVANHLVSVVPFSSVSTDFSMLLIQIALLLATVVLIPLFVYAYSRLILPDQQDDAQRAAVRRVLVAVAAAQIVLLVGLRLMQILLPRTPEFVDPMLFVCVIVILSVMSQFREIR